MASQAAVLPRRTTQVAKAIAGALPSELSQSPLLGILGVVMGAGIVTLTGRMLTLGPPISKEVSASALTRRMDRQRLQRRAHVHRSVHGLYRRLARAAPRASCGRRLLHSVLRCCFR